jgi:hypothetical protein
MLGAAEFGAEYEANFREDIETYLPLEVISAAIIPARVYLEYEPGIVYQAFCDPAEGLRKGRDSMTFAVAHPTEDRPKKYILDVLLEFVPPFDPKEIIRQIVETCRQYQVTNVIQDRHAIGWIGADLKEHNIAVEVSDMNKSQIYEHFAVLMNKRQVELVDNPRLKTQMQGLMKFLKGGGAVSIDHLRSGHDDVVNSAAGAIVAASRTETPIRDEIQFGISYYPESLEDQLEREAREWLCNKSKTITGAEEEKPKKKDDDFDDDEWDIEKLQHSDLAKQLRKEPQNKNKSEGKIIRGW